MVVTDSELAKLAPLGIRRLTRAQYDCLVDAGAFGEDEKVELLKGFLVEMSPQGAPHASVVAELTELLVSALRGRAKVRCQLPLVAGDDSEPEPDVAVVPIADYSTHHPTRAHLVVEVAVTSDEKDRSIKAELYAQAGVTEYWLVDVEARAIEVRTQPGANGYAHTRICAEHETIAVVAFPDVSLRVGDVLPKR